ATGRRVATAALAGTVLYAGCMLGLTSHARERAREAARSGGLPPPLEAYAGPLPAAPTARDLLLVHADHYRPGTAPATGPVALAPRPIPIGAADPRVATALAAPCARGMRAWMRYPFFAVAAEAGGAAVHILDARYVRAPARGFGATTVLLGPAGEVLGCR
ncbi:MAG TPA: hypothetical protein VMT16_09140, partial [Thermoanaerobaculia bacterium]|nr:hypothetical protein [Thermoanaerobaculia bacterium]